MVVYPKVRCPVCGMVVWLRNLNRNHNPDFFKIYVGGYGGIRYEKTTPMGDDPYDFWINRLEGVILWLKSQKKQGLKLKSVELEGLRAWGISVSMMTEISNSKLKKAVVPLKWSSTSLKAPLKASQ